MDGIEVQAILKKIDGVNIHSPDLVIVSGKDSAIADSLVTRIRKKIFKEIGEFQLIVFSPDKDEHLRFAEEAFQSSLFAGYRFIVLRKANMILESVISSKDTTEKYSWNHNFKNIPENTWILIEYEGKAPESLLSLLPENKIHLETKELYPNKIRPAIINSGKQLQLQLDEAAISELEERVEPKLSEIERALERVREIFGTSNKIGVDEVREILFPQAGWNPFKIVDNLFSGNLDLARRELTAYNPPSDHYLVLVRAIFLRLEEVRKAKMERNSGGSEKHVLQRIGHSQKSGFIQKKIMDRLSHEMSRFDQEKMKKLYDALAEFHFQIRMGADERHHPTLFEMTLLPLF